MSAERGRRFVVRRCLVPVVAVALMQVFTPAGTAGAVPQAVDQEYVKFYRVTASYQDKPETLAEIAQRFLGSANRSTEIYRLNAGRPQADGGTVSSSTDLHAGWVLVLPWDATGAGVEYGLPSTLAGSENGASTVTPSSSAGPPRPPTAGGACAAGVASSSRADWAALRLASDQAWSRTRGKGQLVAVVDSGVEAKVPQLAGHVAAGADIVTGSGRGDADCLGSGTAIAGIIAAQRTSSSPLVGIAPEADVLPVRVVTTSPGPKPAEEVTAIEVAVSAGATVIALGSFVNIDDPAVAGAVSVAVAHNVLVVAGASAASASAGASASASASAASAGASGASAGQATAGALRVGGVGVDGQPVSGYRSGGVDVVAPGINVTVLGLAGGMVVASGTQYAVAFVAGLAALVRAAYPSLTVAQVVHRIEKTSDKMTETAPDSRFGWGLINPGASVNAALGDEHAVSSAHGRTHSSTGGEGLILFLIAVTGLSAAALLAFGIRGFARSSADKEEPADEGDGTRDDGDGTRDLRSA